MRTSPGAGLSLSALERLSPGLALDRMEGELRASHAQIVGKTAVLRFHSELGPCCMLTSRALSSIRLVRAQLAERAPGADVASIVAPARTAYEAASRALGWTEGRR